MKPTNRSKGTVRFSFKSIAKLKENKSEEHIIFLFFTYGKNKTKLSTGYKCNFNNWDFKKQRVKNVTSVNNKDEINKKLNQLEEAINEVYNNALHNNELISSQLLKNRLKNKLNNNGASKSNDAKVKQSLIEFFESFISSKENNIHKNTLKTYKQCLQALKDYEVDKNKNLEFEDIDLTFHDDYIKFLESSKNFKPSTIQKHIKLLKAVMNRALDNGVTTNSKHKSSNFTAKGEENTEVYLDDEEIKRLEDKDLAFNKKYDEVRDIFLVGYYTGQRYSDYSNFSKKDIVEIDGFEYIKIIQEKNYKAKRTIHCPVTREIKKIMKKYNGDFPPKVTSKHVNENIKFIAKCCKIDNQIKVEYTKGGKRYKEYVPKHKLIGTHTARRSFATNKYRAGMPTYDIMFFTGHTTEKEFYKYIRIKDEERVSNIAKSGFFNM